MGTVDDIAEDVRRAAAEDHEGERIAIDLVQRPFLPPPFPEAAMPGPWRQLIGLWEPFTSAHPGSIVPPALVLCGVNGGEGVRVGQQRTVDYVGLVGVSSVGRKDTGLNIAIDLMERIVLRPRSYLWGQPNSGEGIWYELRDANGKDPGATDKRLCLIDTEMGGTCAAMHRPNSTVQPAMCSLWDRGSKKPLTKNDRITVTNGHFAYIGLTTPRQFLKHVTFEDRENGWIQRLCIAAVGEVRQIPLSVAIAPDVDEPEFDTIASVISNRMAEAVSHGRSWRLGADARQYLDDIAPGLVDPARPETTRAGAHVTRWAMLYCLTVPPEAGENAPPGVVALSHMKAAAAIWGYFDASARIVLGGDDLLEKILIYTGDSQSGCPRSELLRLLGGHVTAAELDDAIHRGVEQGKLRAVKIDRGKKRGRPPIVIEAI